VDKRFDLVRKRLIFVTRLAEALLLPIGHHFVKVFQQNPLFRVFFVEHVVDTGNSHCDLLSFASIGLLLLDGHVGLTFFRSILRRD